MENYFSSEEIIHKIISTAYGNGKIDVLNSTQIQVAVSHDSIDFHEKRMQIFGYNNTTYSNFSSIVPIVLPGFVRYISGHEIEWPIFVFLGRETFRKYDSTQIAVVTPNAIPHFYENSIKVISLVIC